MNRFHQQSLQTGQKVRTIANKLFTIGTLTLGFAGLVTMYTIVNSVLTHHENATSGPLLPAYCIPGLIGLAVLFLVSCVTFANRLVSRAEPMASTVLR